MASRATRKVLIADEPTTALDVTIQAQILELMVELQEKYGTAIVMITHDLGVVSQLADKVMVMYAGRAVEQATTDDVFYDPLMPYSWSLLRSLPTPRHRGRGEAAADRGHAAEPDLPSRRMQLQPPLSVRQGRVPRDRPEPSRRRSRATRPRASSPSRRSRRTRAAWTRSWGSGRERERRTVRPRDQRPLRRVPARDEEPEDALPHKGRRPAAHGRARQGRGRRRPLRPPRARRSGSSGSLGAARARSPASSCACWSRRRARSSSTARTSWATTASGCSACGATCR